MNNIVQERLKYLSLKNTKQNFIIHSQEFIETHLPCVAITSTDPVADPEKELFPVNWYGEKAYLIQSVQLHKQMLMAAGFNRIFSILPFWRAEEKMTPRHLSEAWSLDLEISKIRSEEE